MIILKTSIGQLIPGRKSRQNRQHYRSLNFSVAVAFSYHLLSNFTFFLTENNKNLEKLVDIFSEIIGFIGNNIIKGISISVLVVIFCRKIFKNKFDTKNAISIIKWIIIGYTVLILVNFLLLALLPTSSKTFISSISNRATGQYSFAFWLMLLGAISPLILFYKKLGNRFYLIFVLAIFIKIGWLMELLVIHLNLIKEDGIITILPSQEGLIIILQGIILGVSSLAIGNCLLSKNSLTTNQVS